MALSIKEQAHSLKVHDLRLSMKPPSHFIQDLGFQVKNLSLQVQHMGTLIQASNKKMLLLKAVADST